MKLFIPFLIISILVSCAQINTLTGGAKDNTAPKINVEKSIPKQGQLNYTSPKMTLVFDEFIVLKNPTNTISITPQPVIPPTITSKNKKLEIIFNDPLLTNTTYSITFNGAITDLNEGNDSLFQYVFSTGPYIDSLQFKGMVTHAFTNKVSESILIGLYPISNTISADSLPYKTKPTYIGQTNKKGQFHLNYIKEGNYLPYAFTDIDNNLLFNPASEQIGFLTAPNCCLTPLSDSNNFKLFDPIKNNTGLKSISLTYPGQVTLIFKEKQPADFKLNYSISLIQELTERSDSLIYWLSKPYKNQTEFVLSQGESMDTLRAIMNNIPKKTEAKPLSNKNNYHDNKLLPDDTLTYIFNQPIKINDKSLITLMDKDSNILNYTFIIKNLRTLQLITNYDSLKYISIDSAAIRATLTDNVNNEINMLFEKHPAKYYGQLLLDLKADSSKNYIIQLLDMTGKIISEQLLYTSIAVTTFSNLLPGNYQIRLIEDRDNNTRWSTGDVSKQLQPEPVFYYTSTIKIRSNWDLDLEWILQN